MNDEIGTARFVEMLYKPCRAVGGNTLNLFGKTFLGTSSAFIYG